MTAVNYSTLRADMKHYMDAVSDNFDTVVVTRKGSDRNIVMISEETYNNLLENAYIRADNANYSWLLESRNQLFAGKSHKMDELS